MKMKPLKLLILLAPRVIVNLAASRICPPPHFQNRSVGLVVTGWSEIDIHGYLIEGLVSIYMPTNDTALTRMPRLNQRRRSFYFKECCIIVLQRRLNLQNAEVANEVKGESKINKGCVN